MTDTGDVIKKILNNQEIMAALFDKLTDRILRIEQDLFELKVKIEESND